MSDELRRKLASAALIFGALLLAGTGLSPLAEDAGRAARPPGTGTARELAGEGLMIASLGGMRTLTADVFWLRAYLMWEKQNRTACTAYARLACALSPETAYFREGYASWMAFEFPHWSIREAGGTFQLDEAAKREFHRRDATAALAWLEQVATNQPDEARFPLLAGEICDIKLKDKNRAMEYYRKSSATPAAPWAPTRRYAEHLVFNGRYAEALAFMRDYATRVPADSERHRDALADIAAIEEAQRTATR